MSYTNYQIFVMIVFVVAGSAYTLVGKWPEKLNSVGSDGESRKFNHPFVQTWIMFFGEIFCLPLFHLLCFWSKRSASETSFVQNVVKGNHNFNRNVLCIIALCDLIGTVFLFIGLSLTYASSVQMLRGSIIIFVAILSVIFLKRSVKRRELFGICFVIAGLTIVGMGDFMSNDDEQSYSSQNILIGDVAVIVAQMFIAVQIILEERFIGGRDIPPLLALGWEGIFGFLMMTVLLIPLNFINVPLPFGENAHNVLEDLPDALAQIGNSVPLIIAMIGTTISVSFFNFGGITMTKEISSTARVVTDAMRTVIVWISSLLLNWQQFEWLQLIGFAILIIGIFAYNFNFSFNELTINEQSVSFSSTKNCRNNK